MERNSDDFSVHAVAYPADVPWGIVIDIRKVLQDILNLMPLPDKPLVVGEHIKVVNIIKTDIVSPCRFNDGFCNIQKINVPHNQIFANCSSTLTLFATSLISSTLTTGAGIIIAPFANADASMSSPMVFVLPVTTSIGTPPPNWFS